MKVLVGGGTGFLGRALTRLLKSRGHEVTVVSRQPGEGRITWADLSANGLPSCDAAVNLAGENILNPLRRWNEDFKNDVVSSRLETTRSIAKAISEAETPPRVWVLVTGVGYYPPSLTAEYTEESPGGDFDFLSRLVKDWEAVARLPGNVACQTRQVVVRSGKKARQLRAITEVDVCNLWVTLISQADAFSEKANYCETSCTALNAANMHDL